MIFTFCFVYFWAKKRFSNAPRTPEFSGVKKGQFEGHRATCSLVQGHSHIFHGALTLSQEAVMSRSTVLKMTAKDTCFASNWSGSFIQSLMSTFSKSFLKSSWWLSWQGQDQKLLEADNSKMTKEFTNLEDFIVSLDAVNVILNVLKRKHLMTTS